MFRAFYLSFLFFLLLCLRWWELPAEIGTRYSRLRWRISRMIADTLTDRNERGTIMEPS